MEAGNIIYLDTHVAVWLYAGKINAISETARQMIEDNAILISPMVMLEIDFLQEIKRIAVSGQEMVTYLHECIGLSVCDKDFLPICQNATHLSWTRDPFDRIITAHADMGKNPLITKDNHIRENYEWAVW